jgi:hypothetical protein
MLREGERDQHNVTLLIRWVTSCPAFPDESVLYRPIRSFVAQRSSLLMSGSGDWAHDADVKAFMRVSIKRFRTPAGWVVKKNRN